MVGFDKKYTKIFRKNTNLNSLFGTENSSKLTFLIHLLISPVQKLNVGSPSERKILKAYVCEYHSKI